MSSSHPSSSYTLAVLSTPVIIQPANKLKILTTYYNHPVLTTTQLAILQYTPMKHLKISCQKHKIDRCMTNYMNSCSFLQAHFFE